MAAVLDEPQTVVAAEVIEPRVLLRNISWETYECLLKDLENSSVPHLTYDRGVLEIMSPQTRHENAAQTVNLLLAVVCEEFDLDIQGLGCTTFKREELERGFEADACFYIKNSALVRGKDRLDLPADPPPEIVFEVDITGSSLHRNSIFFQLGVLEVWRYNGKRVEILNASAEGYVNSEASSALPFITTQILEEFIAEGFTHSRLEWFKKVRAWVRQQKQVL